VLVGIERDTLHRAPPCGNCRFFFTGSVLHCRQRRRAFITSQTLFPKRGSRLWLSHGEIRRHNAHVLPICCMKSRGSAIDARTGDERLLAIPITCRADGLGDWSLTQAVERCTPYSTSHPGSICQSVVVFLANVLPWAVALEEPASVSGSGKMG